MSRLLDAFEGSWRRDVVEGYSRSRTPGSSKRQSKVGIGSGSGVESGEEGAGLRRIRGLLKGCRFFFFSLARTGSS